MTPQAVVVPVVNQAQQVPRAGRVHRAGRALPAHLEAEAPQVRRVQREAEAPVVPRAGRAQQVPRAGQVPQVRRAAEVQTGHPVHPDLLETGDHLGHMLGR